MEHSFVGVFGKPNHVCSHNAVIAQSNYTLGPESILPLTPLYPPSCKPCVHFMGFFSRIRRQPDAVKDSLRILSPFIGPHHVRMPQRFGRELFGNLGAFF